MNRESIMNPADLNRRQFVILGSATVAGLAIGAPVFGTGRILDSSSFVSVGFHAGRTRLRLGGRGSSTPMSFVDASTLVSGDPIFFRNGGKLRIHDFRRAGHGNGSERVDVEALFAIPELEQAVPFYAFSSISGPSREMTAHSVAFNMPVESTGTVDLAILRQNLDQTSGDRAVVSFTVNDGPTPAFKLNEGLYAIAILQNGQQPPDWRTIRTSSIVPRDARVPVSLVHDSFGEETPVPFDYLLLSVIRATSPEEPAVRNDRSIAPSEEGVGHVGQV